MSCELCRSSGVYSNMITGNVTADRDVNCAILLIEWVVVVGGHTAQNTNIRQ